MMLGYIQKGNYEDTNIIIKGQNKNNDLQKKKKKKKSTTRYTEPRTKY